MKKLAIITAAIISSLTLFAGVASAYSQRDLTVTASSVSGGYAYGSLSTSAYNASAIVFIDTSVTWEHTCANADGNTFTTTGDTRDHRDIYNVTPVYKGKKVDSYNWSINGFNNGPASNACPTGTTEIHAPRVIASSGQAYLSTDGGITKLTDQSGQPIFRPLGF